MNKNIPEIIVKKIRSVVGPGRHSLHEPFFFGNEWKYVKKTLDDNYVSSVGGFIKKFEDKLKKFTGSKYAIAVVNGTAALHLAMKACGIKNNEEVLVPTLTFIGTANAINYCGAIPHFIDCELSTLGIDPKALEKYLKKNTKKAGDSLINIKTKRKISAIIPVHIFGNICQIEKINQIAKKFNLIVIEDAAEALGTFLGKKHAGNFGIAGCISFNGNKILTTGGGGVIITNNKKLSDKIRHLSTTAKINHSWEYIHDQVGYNYRMPNLNAALGVAQVENLKKFLQSKRKLFTEYNKKFSNIDSIKVLKEAENSKSNYWLNSIILKKPSIKNRDKIIQLAKENNIYLRPLWRPLHTLRPYKSMPSMPIKNADIIYKSLINIPSSSFYFLNKKKLK